ncbi:MAG TPA: ATP-binding protein [Terriglobales bacterium]|nr:ATP-binding protein [Terriglobales bacterium]
MKKRISIRARLTMWYAVFLAAALILFTVTAILLMRHSIYVTVYEELQDEMNAVRALIEKTDTAGLPSQVRAHAELQAGSSLLQVSDEHGFFLYRSPRLQELGLSPRQQASGKFAILWFGRTPLQFLSATVQSEGHTLNIQVAKDMDDYFEATARYELLLIVGIPALLITAIASGYWISRRALAPVDAITYAAQQISPSDLTGRVFVPKTGDELQRLAETINRMLERIEGAFRRITQFTADASHELRTPVTLIRTRAEITLRKSRQDREYQDALGEILHESERMSALIENLMVLARADTGTETLHFRKVNLCEIAQRASAQGSTLSAVRQLTWSDKIPDTPVWVNADPDSLARLLLILVDNAVKYTPERGSVGLLVSTSNGHAAVEVYDTGIGIGEADLPHIFERFYRADRARSRDSGGAGLGLSIGQWIARAHHAEISINSASNAGSCFEVRLPVANPQSD